MPATHLVNLIVIVASAFGGGVLLKLMNQPPVVGYLIAGLLLGVLGIGEIGGDTVKLLSELGVVLLLFTLGLEFSVSHLRKIARVAIVGGLAQILLTAAVASVLFLWMGFALPHAVVMAFAFSLSSTAVVVKVLSDRGELETVAGELMVAWLIIQDIAVVPLIILLPFVESWMGQGGIGSALQVGQLLQMIGLSATFLILGRIGLPPLISTIASFNSRELLLVGTFLIAVIAGALTQLVGLSAALGAFLVGILIAESAQTQATFSEIRPLRDLFALLFFTSLGLILPSGFLFTHFGQIIAITIAIVVIKFVVATVIALRFGYHAKNSLLVGVGLVEVGEFAFVLAGLALTQNIIDTETYGLILSVALLSILMMPPLYTLVPSWYTMLRDWTKIRASRLYIAFFAHREHRDTLPELPFADHVVLCGYGRVGKYIGRALTLVGIPFVVIEFDHRKVLALRKLGLTVVYGDPADIDILDYAQVDRARAIVIAIPDLSTQEMVVASSLKLNKKIAVFCRTHHEEHQKYLKNLGVTAVIQPEFEASLSVVDKILHSFGHKDKIIDGKISRLKLEHGLG